MGAAAAEWADTLAGLDNAALTHGFDKDAERGDDWPPSSAKFRAMSLPPKSDAPRTYLGSQPVRREFTAIESEHSREVAKREIAAMCEQYGVELPEGFRS